ncbi:cellulose synthase-like B3 [Arabidopsis thaliana]|jgi:cellulose synthase/poly-beta-1,6-N-acetylglucosamine synthase-like glycosyltransferase|uniref:Cellulose synthase-like protein B3 n=2 Tax=Arabidopsis thaliana TaxID=3702 RepID=CSLB3_ARATH|eukprot:NP_850190.1 cellulose synthase-like B3 [Arabidopsis thaliana]
MADSSSSLPPLCEKISYKNYFLRVVDLTILGFLFSLLLYRILLMNQNNSVWVVAFLCESFFSFIWLLITSIKWSPASYKSYPERLDERVHDLPSVDMFVTTADPVREPPILVANTLLSLLAVNYPANKLACYVSDDGCSPLTYFSLKEASKFAKIWVPFCKKYNIKVRAPFRYFLNPPAATESSEFSKDWEITKREYEKLSRRVEDATGDSHWLDAEDDFEDFSNTKPNDHSTIVKVVWENKGGVGVENEVPHFVYISREKRPNYLHHYKAGAMNFLVRVSGLMTNAPYMLNVDCDMYANEADVVRQAMCIFLQKSMNSNHCAFVQFPQEFYDSNADELTVLQSYLGRGIAGIQGPTYAGSGCFHTRRVMYGLSIDDLEDDGSLSSLATRKYLAEENLAREFGNSNEMVTSVVEALQRKPNPQNTLANSLEAAQEVGHCHFEYQTSWGKTIGWLYESTAEDANTSIGIHSRGWTSSYISPKPPAFLGAMPPGGPEAMLQQRRWATGLLEVLFNKQSPLIGMFCRKIRFRQSLAYLYIFTWGLRSIPELIYCLLPAYCLLHNAALFPKGVYLGIVVTLVGMHCLYSLWEFMSLGFSVQSWFASQSFWRIKTTCSWLFSIPDIILKLLGISKTVFIVTKKTMPKTMSGSGSEKSQREVDCPNQDSGKFEFDGSLYFLPGTFILLVNLAALAGCSVGLQRHRGGGSGLAEACGCILVVILFLPFLKGMFEKGKYGIPWSTLSKAAFLAVLFVVFSVGN